MYPSQFPRLLSGGLCLLFWVLLLAGCQTSYSEPSSQPPPPPEVGTLTLQHETLALSTELPGRTSAYRIAEIRPQINGMIQKRLFEEGTDVKEGQILYQIDPSPFQVAHESAKASLGKAEANLPPARSRVERYRDLLQDNAVSHQDYEDASAALLQVQAEIAYWKSAVDAARINLDYTRIKAPFPGRIGRTQARTGTLVTAYQPTALSTVQQLDPIYVDVTQSSAELLRLTRSLQSGLLNEDKEKSTRVRLLLEDGTPYPLEGRLQFRDVTVDPATSSFSLRIVVPNPDHVLLPGMFVRAVIQEGTTDQAILVPQQGVGRNPKGEPVALVVDEKNTVQQRALVLNRAIRDQWLITSGLAPGDRLIVEGLLKVRPGMQVEPVPASLLRESTQQPAISQLTTANQP
ncbi:efflux RND transporter periplasmic adaptor subunit [Desulfobotulus sp.]|uniref:efflux RND transporter periplasmic adaptor subunit n=1 Tax=Desulfobotulus sp. TaxID=1940337 RepID=UPI002A36D34E|nr:efflux RND transporter periplasmic adaptor subunit [Desulfobotulus sp.]MDY0162909.1 efflux RND transporter periplasmic adaptor subunit [Desulfobotulus sp.]